MSRATGNLATGTGTFLGGLALWRFTGGVDLPVISPTAVGVVLMCLGCAEVLLGLFRSARR
ncbi:DUF5708 family protein [Streptomyces sp. bgisy022]|uniref:DUF5708 family protein n=1 Tax=Streptomyces sp. bgisy022 TaxID=3413769 RepID=UPI003D729132